jgi:glutamine amidotransferase
MSIIIIDYGAGNLRSVAKALEHVARGKRVTVTSNSKQLADATHIVLPGVGAFGDCMHGLTACPGMREALEEQVRVQKKPMLGICVGMQMLLTTGHEHGTHAGLGWITGDVVALTPAQSHLKVPHMGWNELDINAEHPLLSGIQRGDHAYFVHSYHAVCENAGQVIASAEYGQRVTAVIAHENIMGTQFHPEKSQATGLRLLQNFTLM